ncbi:MAG: outer membrane protein assembly factor BamB family protein, partial [Bdellovibrionota bacterium]
MKIRFLAVCALLAGCSHISRPGPDRKPLPVLSKGWTFIEPEKEFTDQESGVDPVSFSAPVISGEKLVFGSERFGLVALNKKSGQQLWRRKLDGALQASPLVSDTVVYAGTETGALYALDLAGGREKSHVMISGPVQGSPHLASQRLYVGTADEALHCLDPSSGKIIWTYRRPGFGGTSVHGGGNPAAVNGKIWAGFSDGSLLALNPDTGGVEAEKSFRDNLKFTDIDARVVGWREGMLVSTYDGRLRYLRKDGSVIWEFGSGGARAPVLSDGDVLYFPSSDGAVYALSGNTGKEVWSFPLRRGIPTGLAVVTRNQRKVLLVVGSEEKVYVIDVA